MSFIDPRLRTRAAPAKQQAKPDASKTNLELLADFEQAFGNGQMSPHTLASYLRSLRDAVAYFRTPAGEEIPVRTWTKEQVWGYVLHVEANYCSHFMPVPFTKPPTAKCAKEVWIGMKAPEEALGVCASCPLFQRPLIYHRLNALNKWFRHLARVGIIPFNFMADLRREYSDDHPASDEKGEKKRNPTVEEEVRLVNGTHHPMRRFLYAASAKWWTRPNELFMLDRYASFGEAMPEGCKLPKGFQAGHAAHPDLKPFSEGGDMAYIPDSKGPTDKRRGNRWLVIDDELRPIAEAAFAWWDRMVARDKKTGRPLTTKLALNERGRAMHQDRLNEILREDCERLGLMKPGDVKEKLRRWTGHCQRHFGERLRQKNKIPSDWSNHFRGDAFGDARGDYYRPPPEDVREMYLKLIPHLGFTPIPTARLAPSEEKINRTSHKRQEASA